MSDVGISSNPSQGFKRYGDLLASAVVSPGVQPAQQVMPPPAGGGQSSPLSSLSSAQDYINEAVKDSLPLARHSSSAQLLEYFDAAQKAANRISPEELKANELHEQYVSMNKLAEYEAAHPLPAPELATFREVGSLQLPEVPSDVKPHPNAIASFGAGIAGLFAPVAAGRFGASALAGAIDAAGRETAARKQKYQFDLQQSLLKHEEEVRRVDAEAQVESENNRVRNQFSVADHAQRLEASRDQYEAERIKGTAGDLRAYVLGNHDADVAAARAAALKEQIEILAKEAQGARDTLLRAGTLQASLDKEQRLAADAKAKMDLEKGKAAQTAKFQTATIEQRKQAEADRIAMEASRFAMEDAHFKTTTGLRQQEIGLAHQDRIRGQDLSFAKGTAGGLMHHQTPEEKDTENDLHEAQKYLDYAKRQLQSPSVTNPNYVAPTTTNAEEQRAALLRRRDDVARAAADVEKAKKYHQQAIEASRKAESERRRIDPKLPYFPGSPGGGPIDSGPGYHLYHLPPR